jgi:hypothetical protein
VRPISKANWHFGQSSALQQAARRLAANHFFDRELAAFVLPAPLSQRWRGKKLAGEKRWKAVGA